MLEAFKASQVTAMGLIAPPGLPQRPLGRRRNQLTSTPKSQNTGLPEVGYRSEALQLSDCLVNGFVKATSHREASPDLTRPHSGGPADQHHLPESTSITLDLMTSGGPAVKRFVGSSPNASTIASTETAT